METINYIAFGYWLSYYYKAWTQKNPTKILAEFEKYRKKQYPFNETTYTQFQNDVWCSCLLELCSNESQELGAVAIKIFGICVNSASCEWLFSTMRFLYIPSRNALKVKILQLFSLLENH